MVLSLILIASVIFFFSKINSLNQRLKEEASEPVPKYNETPAQAAGISAPRAPNKTPPQSEVNVPINGSSNAVSIINVSGGYYGSSTPTNSLVIRWPINVHPTRSISIDMSGVSVGDFKEIIYPIERDEDVLFNPPNGVDIEFFPKREAMFNRDLVQAPPQSFHFAVNGVERSLGNNMEGIISFRVKNTEANTLHFGLRIKVRERQFNTRAADVK